MPLLNIDLMTPDGILFEGNEIPDDLQSGELISRLVNTLSLPRSTAAGAAIRYSLEIVNQGVRLQSGQTLGEAGATNGDVIRLLSSHKIQKPSELKSPQTPVAANESALKSPQTPANGSPPDYAHTASGRNGAVIIIPVRGSNASVNKILGRLNDSLGIKPEEVSVLNASTSNLNAKVSAALQPSRPSVFGKYRTVTLAVMVVGSLLFLIFAISSKNKRETIARAKEARSESTSAPSPTPVPVEPTPDPTPEPTPEPTPDPMQEPPARQSSTPIRRTTVKGARVEKFVQPKPTPAPTAQPAPIKLPEAPPKQNYLIAARNVSGKMSPTLNTMPKTVAQNDSAEIPEPPKKCGIWRKMTVGCKNKQSKKSKKGGAVGVAESAAESKAKATIRQGVRGVIP